MARRLFEKIDVPRKGDSVAVVAMGNGELDGIVLWYRGESITREIHQCGRGTTVEGLRLDQDFDCPVGVSIWEGEFLIVKNEYFDVDGEEFTIEAIGMYRDPTDEEWDFIKRGEPPWSGEEDDRGEDAENLDGGD